MFPERVTGVSFLRRRSKIKINHEVLRFAFCVSRRENEAKTERHGVGMRRFVAFFVNLRRINPRKRFSPTVPLHSAHVFPTPPTFLPKVSAMDHCRAAFGIYAPVGGAQLVALSQLDCFHCFQDFGGCVEDRGQYWRCAG